MQSNLAATHNFLNTIWKPVNVDTLRHLKLESEDTADGDPSTYFTALGCAIRSEFWGEDADDDTAPDIDWDEVARFTDEWLDSDECDFQRGFRYCDGATCHLPAEAEIITTHHGRPESSLGHYCADCAALRIRNATRDLKPDQGVQFCPY